MTIRYQVITPCADIREAPDAQAMRGKRESQLSYGETFVAEREDNGWVYGHSAHDGYSGYVARDQLAPAPAAAATHVVTMQATQLYPAPDIKSPPALMLGFGACLRVAAVANEKFSRLDRGLYAITRHLSAVDEKSDFVTLAERLVGTPYVWAGRSGLGIDCSGMVQTTLARGGYTVPRDSEEQEKTIGQDVTALPRQRGDIVFFTGHVGIMVDSENLLHATAYYMQTVVEPLADVIARGTAVTSVRRI